MIPTDILRVDGIDYSARGINDLRAELGRFRDEAMAQGAFDTVVVLSHAIALLACLAEIAERPA